MIAKPMFALVPLLLAACATVPAGGPTVKVTPLGTHAGELCNRDRAMIFEDPTGVRVLYDAGASVLGGDDARLGAVHVVLLSHAHGDHMGDQRLTALGAGTCQSPTLATAAPNTTTAEIAASKNAGLVMINQMANFLGKRVEAIKGQPTGACPVGAAGDDHTVPFAASCLAGNNLGGTRTFKTAGAAKGVEITIVPASHDSSVNRVLLNEAERRNLEPDNLTLPLGPPSGYVDPLHQRPGRLPDGRHRGARGHEDRRRGLPQAQRDGAEPGAQRDHDGVGRLHRERADPAGDRDHLAPQRGRVGRRQGASWLAHRRALRDAAQPGRARAVRPDDGVRRAGQVRGRLQLTSRAVGSCRR